MNTVTISDARTNFRQVLDQASAGRPVAVVRRGMTGESPGGAAIVDLPRLVQTLRLLLADRFKVFVDDDERWLAVFSGSPLLGEGDTVFDAVVDLVDVLNEYVEDWDRLRHAPNHAANWPLVQMVALSEPGELAQWVLGLR